MYPKLNPDPVFLFLCSGERMIRVDRKHVAGAYAGAWAAKECVLKRNNPLFPYKPTFEEEYQNVYPACIEASNKVGMSATPETIEHFNPSKGTTLLLKEQAEHSDNPFYPFFEEE